MELSKNDCSMILKVLETGKPWYPVNKFQILDVEEYIADSELSIELIVATQNDGVVVTIKGIESL